ncbi:MAG: hypothetical protein DCF16_00030 [Alphaproteobacteria bacterium]|nr:MAG: hypothetical protein DCF16_00030 [Alphaproteobacteria bacterium]
MGDITSVLQAALAVAGAALLALAFWPFLAGREKAEERKIGWRALALGVALIGVALWQIGGRIGSTDAHPDVLQNWVLTASAVAAGLGALLLVISVIKISSVAMGKATDPAFGDAFATAVVGLVLLALGFVTARADGWEPPRFTALENNFEVLLLAAALSLVVLCGWTLRAWANAAAPAVIPARRERAFDISVIIASALGILVFVGIGASAFAARLAQREIEDLIQTTSSQISPERVLGAVEGILIYDNRIIALRQAEATTEERQRALGRTSSDLAGVAMRGELEFWTIFSDLSALTGVQKTPEPLPLTREQWERGDPQPSRPTFVEESARVLTESSRRLPTDEGERRRANEILIQLRALQQTIRESVMASDASASELRAIQFGIQDARDAQECEIRRLALLIDDTRPQVTGEAPTRLRDFLSNCNEREPPTATAYQHAVRLVGAVRPLSRSWMSNSLARRAPITLSIELVLVMGALGAMLQAIGAQLARMLNMPLKTGESSARLTLSTLGTQVLFGTATALALFVLLNVVIGASSLTVNDAPPQGNNLNPFAMAALGLIGGYSSLKVAEWMGGLLEDVLKQRATYESRLNQLELLEHERRIRDAAEVEARPEN